MVYDPAEDVVRVVAMFVAAFVAVTFAPATTAPVLSVTVPVIVAAIAATGNNIRRAERLRKMRLVAYTCQGYFR